MYRLSRSLEEKLTKRPASLSAAFLDAFPGNGARFVRFAGALVQGTALIDPALEPPIRIVRYDAGQIDSTYVRASLDLALQYRRYLAAKGQLKIEPPAAWRLIHDGNDGLPGLAVDVFGAFAFVHVYSQAWEPYLPSLYQRVKGYGIRGIYATHRQRGGMSKSHHVYGDVAAGHTTEIEEDGLRYRIDLANGPATGLYLDQRTNRRIVAALTDARTLLNTFSYTCAFSLAAARQGAKTTNVDLSKAALQKAIDNFERNGVALTDHVFLPDDVFVVLPRLAKKGQRFHTVLLDPPTFSRGRKGVFSTERDYARLVTLAAPLVEPGGVLVAFANTYRLTESDWRRQVLAGLGNLTHQFRPERTLTQDVDFRYLDESRRYLKGWVLRRL